MTLKNVDSEADEVTFEENIQQIESRFESLLLSEIWLK